MALNMNYNSIRKALRGLILNILRLDSDEKGLIRIMRSLVSQTLRAKIKKKGNNENKNRI